MDYHLLCGVNKYLRQTSINIVCSLDKFNNRFKQTYLYRIPIIRIHNRLITDYTSKKYKYIVTGINNGKELMKVMDYGLYIIGILLDEFSSDIDNLHKL